MHERLPNRMRQHVLSDDEMIGGQQDDLRLRIQLRHMQDLQQDPVGGAAIAWLDDDVRGGQTLQVASPPTSMIFRHDDTYALPGADPPRTRDGGLQQG